MLSSFLESSPVHRVDHGKHSKSELLQANMIKLESTHKSLKETQLEEKEAEVI